MPQPTASPRHERATGRSTAASAGPMSSGPTNGLPTVRPCTSWSYWRTIGSFEATLASAKARSSSSPRSIPAGSPGDGSTLPRRPDALQLARRHAIVQERAIEIGDDGAVVADPEPAVARKAADRRSLDTFPGKDLLQRRPALGRHRQHHPLLRFGEPDLPWPQSVVLERHTRQLDVGPQLARHLADRRREPARSAVGDGAVEPEIARARQGVGQALLDDGIADLDDAAKLRVTWPPARRMRTSRRGCRRARRALRRRRSDRRRCGCVGRRPRGARPTVPQKTSGFATYPWSNRVAPLTVGMPILLP